MMRARKAGDIKNAKMKGNKTASSSVKCKSNTHEKQAENESRKSPDVDCTNNKESSGALVLTAM
eukprot:9662846-Ditylum_brightwellii.AAC.1